MVTSLISHEIRMKSPTIFKAPNPSVAINNFEGFDCRGGSEILRVFSAAGCMFFSGTVGIHLGNCSFILFFNGSNTHINIYGSFCWDKHPLTSFFLRPCGRWLTWPSHMLIWSNGLGILNHQPVFPESEWCNGTLLVDGSGGVLPATNRVLGDE